MLLVNLLYLAEKSRLARNNNEDLLKWMGRLMKPQPCRRDCKQQGNVEGEKSLFLGKVIPMSYLIPGKKYARDIVQTKQGVFWNICM